MTRIGAAHQDVVASAGSLDVAGVLATTTGVQATGAAEELELAISELENLLRTHAHELADQLRGRVSDHAATLAGTDWAGASKEQAVLAEQTLSAEVEQVLTQALAEIDAFGQTVRQRAGAYRQGVEGELRAALGHVETAYASLAEVSRQYLNALQLADQTIRAVR